MTVLPALALAASTMTVSAAPRVSWDARLDLIGRARAELGGDRPWGALGLIALFLTPPPELAWTSDRPHLPQDFVRAAGGEAALEAWLAELRRFARRRKSVRDEEAERRAREALGDRPWLAVLDAYLGEPLNAEVEILLSPEFDPSPMNSFIVPYPRLGEAPPGRPRRVYTIARSIEAGPAFSANVVFNEPLYAALSVPLERLAPSLEGRPLLAAARGEGCPPDPRACARHLLVMAVAARLEAQATGREPPLPAGCAGAASARLRAVLREDYEPRRGKYPRLEGFLPELTRALAQTDCPKGP